jgi:sulfofructose kinase
VRNVRLECKRKAPESFFGLARDWKVLIVWVFTQIDPLGGGVPGTSNTQSKGRESLKAPRGVVGLGLCVVDELLVVDEAPAAAQRVRYRQRLVAPGGMVATALAQASRLGCRTQLLSVVGDDPEGRFVARELRALGVGTRRLLRSAACPTSVAVVLVEAETGARRFLVPDRRAVERRAPRFDLTPIRPGRLLLVDGHYPVQALRAVRQARRVGAVVVGDFSDSRPEYHELLPYVDYPIVPSEFGRTWGARTPRETLFALRDEYGGRPVVTEGARGALVLFGGRPRRVPAPRVRVRDTTGAGDVFHGAFAAGLAHGLSEVEAAHLAARAAAGNCTGLGGQARLMTLREMKRAA